MKKFFAEFKTFIARGNVIDMAVGVIVGGAFTSIVNGLSNFILKPIINWLLAILFGKNSLSELYTFLLKIETDVLDEAGNVIGSEIDLVNSIYIDWSSFINAVINFFLIAFVLFTIVKVINKIKEEHLELNKKLKDEILTKADRKALKARGIKLTDYKAIALYQEEKKRLAEEAEAEKAAADAEAARIQRENNPTMEDLLKDILQELRKQ